MSMYSTVATPNGDDVINTGNQLAEHCNKVQSGATDTSGGVDLKNAKLQGVVEVDGEYVFLWEK